ncbi:MAG: glycosyltransferase family 39 protein [Verrucomicrobia bacterium]|nr:glycosyltransferase family 39 protein [Verrucomicrobiota bacterium]
MNLPEKSASSWTHCWPEALLAVLVLVTLFTFLGTGGLNEPDEGRYAEMGREMMAGDSWLVPHLNGIPQFQKPPMIHWAMATSMKIFGVNEWAARLPCALAALGTLLLTWGTGRMLFGRREAALAALVLLSCLEFFALARLLTPDMTMTFWITAAMFCLVKRVRGGGGSIWGWLFFVSMGLGFLTKGPMALVVPASGALAWQWAERKSGVGFRLPWVRGLALTLTLALWWFVVLSVKDSALFSYFAGDELVNRFGSTAHGRSKPWWFFFMVLPAGLFPWTFLMGALFVERMMAWCKGVKPSPAGWFLLGWVIPPFIILSFSGSKLPTYILPLFPALALAAGRGISLNLKSRLWLTAWTLTVFSLFALVSSFEYAGRWGGMQAPEMRPLLIITLILGLVLWRRRALAMPVLGAGMAAGWLLGIAQLHHFNDELAQQATVRPLAELLRKKTDVQTATIFSCDVAAHGWEFYLGRKIYCTRNDSAVVLPLTPEQEERLPKSPEHCAKLMLAKHPSFGLVRSGRFDRTFGTDHWEILGRSGDFLLIASKP